MHKRMFAMIKINRRIPLILCGLLCASLIFSGCAKGSDESTKKPAIEGEKIMVQIEMESGGIIKLELYPSVAPVTVANFVKIAKEGFYDGLIFHRVIKNFMIQGGDPAGTGFGGSSEKIFGEFAQNGYDNPLPHERGVISMARSSNPNSASSQFFILHKDAPHLNGSYAAFGRVVSGMEVVDEIASVKVDKNDRPLTPQMIKSVTVLDEGSDQ